MWKDFQAIDDMLPSSGNKPETFSSLSLTTPLIGGRKVNPATAGSGEVGKFYKFYNEVTPALMSYEKAVSNGQPERATEIWAEHGKLFQAADVVKDLKADIDGINSAMNTIKNTESYSPAEKRQQLDDFNQMRIELARRANALLKEFKVQ
jgi:hypothetical protein